MALTHKEYYNEDYTKAFVESTDPDKNYHSIQVWIAHKSGSFYHQEGTPEDLLDVIHTAFMRNERLSLEWCKWKGDNDGKSLGPMKTKTGKEIFHRIAHGVRSINGVEYHILRMETPKMGGEHLMEKYLTKVAKKDGTVLWQHSNYHI